MKYNRPNIDLEQSEDNPFFLSEDEQAVLGQYILNFQSNHKADHISPLYLSGSESEDDFEDKLARADRIINFLLSNIMFCGQHIYPLALINDVVHEIERLYGAIQELADKKGKSIKDLKIKEMEKAVNSEFNNHNDEFKYINNNHLEIEYSTAKSQRRRDFIAPILIKYLESKGVTPPGIRDLFKVYCRMQKHLNKP
ncbi:MAG: hypothetical protein WCJ37_10905 [Syntrophus sp. (in: bacteria)]